MTKKKTKMEIVKLPETDTSLSLPKDFKLGKSNIFIGKLNIFAAPLKKRHEKYYKGSRFHLIADIILAVLVLGLLATLIYLKTWQPQPEFSLDTKSLNPIITSGSINVFEIKYQAKEVLNQASISIIFPDNFILNKVEPESMFNPTTNTFYLGDLKPNSNGKVKVSGYVFGAVNESQNIISTLSCQSCGDSQRLNSLIYKIEASSLKTEINIPEIIYEGLEFGSLISLKNNSDYNLENIELVLDLNNLELVNSDHLFGGDKIVVESIPAGQTETINLYLKAEAEGPGHLGVMSYFVLSDQKPALQTAVAKDFNAAPFKLKVNIETDSEAINAGEEIVLKAELENQEGQEINNLEVSIDSANSNFIILEQTPTNPVIISNLADQEKTSLEFKIKLARRGLEKNQAVPIKLKTSYNKGEEKLNYEFYSPVIKINTNLNIKSDAYYYSAEGDQLGIGPLPPTVGMPTSYWVFWELNNFGNKLENFSLSATLPTSVSWNNEKSVPEGKVLYSELGKRVVWNLSELSEDETKYKIGFKITVTPGLEDLNKTMKLLEDVTYSATDIFTGQELTGNLPILDTNLKNDQLNSGDGKVVNF
jgi:hypothetical protein